MSPQQLYRDMFVDGTPKEQAKTIRNIRAGGSEFLYESDYPLFPVANDKESYENFAKDYLKMMHYIVTEVGNDKIFNLVKYNNKYDVSEIMSSSPKVYEDILPRERHLYLFSVSQYTC